VGITPHPILTFLLLYIFSLKLDSASANPVINQGFKGVKEEVLSNDKLRFAANETGKFCNIL
jgi:hypothetical protein